MKYLKFDMEQIRGQKNAMCKDVTIFLYQVNSYKKNGNSKCPYTEPR